MMTETASSVIKESSELESAFLNRSVKLEFFLPTGVAKPEEMSLLLMNDGQDLEQMGYYAILESMYATGEIKPVLCVGIHAGEDRKLEYGTAAVTDYKGRGAKAALYQQFIFNELLPYIHTKYLVRSFSEKIFAGFSLGGLSALDITWNNSETFSKVGVFSGSLWWRRKSLEDGYDENTDRIMHQLIKAGKYAPSLKFFFQTGTEDETADRNNNGIIDSIDDTIALIDELKGKGYKMGKDIVYLELEGGRHDVPTWALAMPTFLKWAFGVTSLIS